MSQRVFLIESLTPSGRWMLPRDCGQCGKAIRKPPCLSVKVEGGTSVGKAYHGKYYPRDSRAMNRSSWKKA